MSNPNPENSEKNHNNHDECVVGDDKIRSHLMVMFLLHTRSHLYTIPHREEAFFPWEDASIHNPMTEMYQFRPGNNAVLFLEILPSRTISENEIIYSSKQISRYITSNI